MRSSTWKSRVLTGVAVVSMATGAVGAVAQGSPAVTKVKNADILGQWVAAPGSTYGGTYKTEAANGKCTGTTPYGAGYALKDCLVKGDKLTFVITYGSSYKSYNTDVVSGNYLTGSFHDTNGTKEDYTSVRETNIPTTTKMSCRAVGKTAKCLVNVSYNAKNDAQGSPTGRITLSAKSSKAASCTLAAGKVTDTAVCTATLKSTRATKGIAVKATYGGSAHFRKSIKTVVAR